MLMDAKSKEAFMINIWRDNPIFRQILGICSCLAVTNLVINTFVMCVALTLTTGVSSVLVSVMRNQIPARVRCITQVLLIAVVVSIFDLLLQAYYYDISKQLGAYVGLVITNCIVMGRAEVYAMKNGPVSSFWDGIGAGLGYSLVLLAIAMPREILGFGTLAGMPVMGESWIAWNLMIMPPGAFVMLGLFIWIAAAWGKKVK